MTIKCHMSPEETRIGSCFCWWFMNQYILINHAYNRMIHLLDHIRYYYHCHYAGHHRIHHRYNHRHPRRPHPHPPLHHHLAYMNIKTVFPRYGDSHVKDKTVGETVLSLTWESLNWQDGIFILRRPPVSTRNTRNNSCEVNKCVSSC